MTLVPGTCLEQGGGAECGLGPAVRLPGLPPHPDPPSVGSKHPPPPPPPSEQL